VLLGKNLFVAVVTIVETLLVWIVVAWMFARPSVEISVATVAALLYASLANFAIGNILSVCYPRRLEFGVFRQKKQAGVTMIVALVAQAVLVGLGGIVLALTRSFHRPILSVPIFLAFAIIAAIGYRVSLGRLDSLALSHREALTAELCRAE
ncbi:MAG TPA: hypothetical protein VGR39_05720, partial [Candidatus Acidoferrales bacterium]|nr:hypothetical protein [Candidatus Acidoferrales bacterium]